MLFCLDDLDKKKHRDVINSLKNSFFNPRTATTFSTPRTAKRCHLTPAYISMSKTYDIGYYSFCFQCWLSLAAFIMYTTLWDSPRHYCWLYATKIQCTRIGNCEG